jgi:hypothetical protein
MAKSCNCRLECHAQNGNQAEAVWKIQGTIRAPGPYLYHRISRADDVFRSRRLRCMDVSVDITFPVSTLQPCSCLRTSSGSRLIRSCDEALQLIDQELPDEIRNLPRWTFARALHLVAGRTGKKRDLGMQLCGNPHGSFK